MTLTNQARYPNALSGDTQEAGQDLHSSLRNKLNIDIKVDQQKSSEFSLY